MREKTVLAIDTATENCSVALSVGGKVFLKSEVAPQKHANLVLSMVDSLLTENSVGREDIEAVGFGAGPGSFTGVRIATSTAQALALGLDVDVFAVSDLKLLATPELLDCGDGNAHEDKGYALCAADARMGEVYYALFEKSGNKVVTVIEEKVAKPEDAIADLLTHADKLASDKLALAGTGIAILLDAGLKDKISADLLAATNKSIEENTLRLYPRADAIIYSAMSGDYTLTDPALAEPLYCRNEVTWKKIGEQ